MKKQGVIYITAGRGCVAEALESAASLKRVMPALPVTLFCDQVMSNKLLDQVVSLESDRWDPSVRISHIGNSPYEYTLFLDADTYIAGDLSQLFPILDRFDMALAHSPTRSSYRPDRVPDSFPEFNGGVILFRRSPSVHDLFSRWADYYARDLERLRRGEIDWRRAHERVFYHGNLPDQPTLREALYGSDLRIATLPPEYNCRFSLPGFVDGPVKILHGRGTNLAEVAAAINAVTTRRAYEERSGTIKLIRHREPTRNAWTFENILYTSRRRGLRWTVRAAARRLVGATSRDEKASEHISSASTPTGDSPTPRART
jgi:hypothetical protein